jgi:hypothetical protein
MVASATIGGAAAIIYTPVPSSSAASIGHSKIAPQERDVVTPEINFLAAQAQQLGSEISNAQAELLHLQQEVAYEASLSHDRLSTTTAPVAPVSRATTTLQVPPRTHHETTATENQVGTTTTSESTTTTQATTTTVAPTTTTTVCSHYHGDQSSGTTSTVPTSNCYSGGGNDN